MNLINCSEDCHYQHEGYCKLERGAPVNALKMQGCSYFVKRKKKKTTPANSNASYNYFVDETQDINEVPGNYPAPTD